MLSSRPLRWDILEEQMDEADFLWSRWEAALRAPEYVLAEVRELEERLEAHLDGLELGGTPVAERLLFPVVAESGAEVSRVSAASYVLLAQDGSALEQLRVVLEEGSSTQRAGICRALKLCGWDELETRLLPWLGTQPSPVHSAALEVLVFRGYGLPGGVPPEWVDSEEPAVAAMALHALSLSPASLNRKLLERALGAQADPRCTRLRWRPVRCWGAGPHGGTVSKGQRRVHRAVWRCSCWRWVVAKRAWKY